jgi:hypothetical protein
MSKYEGHTPGEWEAHPVNRTGALSIRQKGDNRSRWIAHTINQGHKTLAEGQANARLMADAPTFYQALKEISVLLSDGKGGEHQCCCSKCPAMKIARKVLDE